MNGLLLGPKAVYLIQGVKMNIVYSNDKMIVEVDGVDTVFVTSKATNGMMSVQVNDDDGFNVVYSEDEQSLSSLSIAIGGEVEILAEAEDASESTEDVEEVIE